MNNYMAVIRKVNYTKSFKLRFEAEDHSAAMDLMYEKANAVKPDDLVEYELYHELSFDRYLSVAFKAARVAQLMPVITPPSYGELKYNPYHLSAA